MCVSGVTSTVMRSVRVKLGPAWVKRQEAGLPGATSVNSPTASPPKRPEEVASFIHGQLFFAWPRAAKTRTTDSTKAKRSTLGVTNLGSRLFAIFRACRFCHHVGVNMPGDAFLRYLRMYAEIIQRVGGRTGIDLFVDKHRLLFSGFIRLAHATVQDRQVVVSCEIVRIDLL